MGVVGIIAPKIRTPEYTMSPGPQGAVGDTNLQLELRHSTPSMSFIYDTIWSGSNASRSGSNVTSGQVLSYISGGGPAILLDGSLGYRNEWKTSHGYTFSDFVPPDTRTANPTQMAIPDYTWRNKIANLEDANTTGRLFRDAPGPVVPTNIVPRGGQYPALVAQAGGRVPANAKINSIFGTDQRNPGTAYNNSLESGERNSAIRL